jgi:hypothetical protein
MTAAVRDDCTWAQEEAGDVVKGGENLGTNTEALASKDNFEETLGVSG